MEVNPEINKFLKKKKVKATWENRAKVWKFMFTYEYRRKISGEPSSVLFCIFLAALILINIGCGISWFFTDSIDYSVLQVVDPILLVFILLPLSDFYSKAKDWTKVAPVIKKIPTGHAAEKLYYEVTYDEMLDELKASQKKTNAAITTLNDFSERYPEFKDNTLRTTLTEQSEEIQLKIEDIKQKRTEILNEIDDALGQINKINAFKEFLKINKLVEANRDMLAKMDSELKELDFNRQLRYEAVKELDMEVDSMVKSVPEIKELTNVKA